MIHVITSPFDYILSAWVFEFNFLWGSVGFVVPYPGPVRLQTRES